MSGPFFIMTENNRRWFTVQTYSGYENKVKANLDQRIESMGMTDKIFKVLVPMEEKVIVKDGKSKRISRKLFPSYVLVEMILDDQSWYVVRHTPGVTGFVGAGNHPIPISEKEINDILLKISGGGEKPHIEIHCVVGDKVRIISGPFVDQSGPITSVNPEKGKVKLILSVFGRETEVEVDYSELEVISSKELLPGEKFRQSQI